MKRMIVHCHDGLTQVALLEDGVLTEFYTERSADRQLVGSVRKGKVVNVLPGMQAAFVDIGLEKNAFLYVDDVLPAHLEKIPPVKPSIAELLRPGQQLLVQVAKEPIGTKGARVTTHVSLPGRWIVYMPDADYVGVSRKIESDAERARLKEIAERLRRPGEGLIVRTVAQEESEDAIERDLNALRSEWSDILRQAERTEPPALLYREPGVLERLVRDVFTDQVDELVIDDAEKGRAVSALIRNLMPGFENRVTVYRQAEPIDRHYGVRQQLEEALRRKIWLKSGGYLIVERTEALTVIDVNTGKFTGTDDLEKTVYAINLEAAQEIGRLVRLLDFGGIILVDFIDMESDDHRAAIVERLTEAMKRDRTKSSVVGWTRLGLLEMTRKKVRESLDHVCYSGCPACGGTGKVRSPLHPSYGTEG